MSAFDPKRTLAVYLFSAARTFGMSSREANSREFANADKPALQSPRL
jgi:hypothetical protein